jgi:cobalt-zinc-cadmium efflux system membrane fusion protein
LVPGDEPGWRSVRQKNDASDAEHALNGNAMLAAVVAAHVGLLATPAGAIVIGGTGRIEPDGGVVVLNGVAGARILSIAVRPGQMVKKGNLLMTLDDREQRTNTQIAEVALAQARKDAAQNLASAQVAVQIDSERFQHALKNAADYRALGPDATSEKQIADSAQTANEAQLQLDEDKKKEAQVRFDNASSISSAAKRLDIELQKLAMYKMTAPIAGMILKIDQHVGENLTGGPAVEMGDIRKMYVICQAFQGDLLKLRPGLRATIKSSAFTKPLKGVVENVGRLVDTKAQLGDVRIRLDDPRLASRVVGMEVEVEIAR